MAYSNVNTKSTENTLTMSNLKRTVKSKNSSKSSINCFKPFLGIFYTGLTSVFFSLTAVFVKQLSYIDPGQLSMVRNIGVWVGCLPIAVYSVKEVFGEKNDRLWLAVRGFLGATGLYLYLTAVRYLPLADAATVMSTTPAVTTVLARIFLKEPCGMMQGFAIVITLCGVLLTVRLPVILHERNTNILDSTYIFGIMFAVGFVLLLSIVYVISRKMKNVHFSVVLIYTGFIGMLENATINLTTAHYNEARCGWDQVLVMLIGIFGFIGHCTMILAIQAEKAGIISVMKASTDIFVALVFQVIFFSVIPDMYQISGAFLVIVSVSIIGFNKWLIALPKDSKVRKRFRYILV